MHRGERVKLDTSRRCADALEFETELRRRVVGQEEAIRKTTEAMQKFMAGLNDPERPIANILLLGPTGSGKTRLVEAVAEVMFGDPKLVVKVDCAEFQHSHEVSKILGSPPGYVGADSKTQITQEKLNKSHREDIKLSVLLLDEIEKAHPNFWELLLGILDKATLTDGKGNTIDFTHTMIFLTSNLGAREVQDAMSGGIGFSSSEEDVTDKRVDKISQDAAIKKFNPEFMNRLDHVIVFHHLDHTSLQKILDIELMMIQKRILTSSLLSKFVLTVSDPAKEYLLAKGTNKRYGARYLKRTLDNEIVTPISNFLLTSQLELGDLLEVVYENGDLKFYRIPAGVIAESSNAEWKDFRKALEESS